MASSWKLHVEIAKHLVKPIKPIHVLDQFLGILWSARCFEIWYNKDLSTHRVSVILAIFADIH